MKRILLVIMLLFFTSCMSEKTKEKKLNQVKEHVLNVFQEAYPGEEFYFIYGPDYDEEKSRTNIRYRGILSTKALEDLDYYEGFQVNLEDVNSPVDTRKYKNTLDYLEVFAPLKKEAKEIFGEGIIFEVDGTYTTAKFNHYKENLGKDVELKPSLGMVVISTFVDDLEKEMENIDSWKEKMFNLGKKYWEYYNATGALQLYIYDKELLYNTKLVEASLNLGAKEDKEVLRVTNKLKSVEELDEAEIKYLVKNMNDSYPFIKGIVRLSLEKYVVGVLLGSNRMESKSELIIDNVEIIKYRGKSN